MAVRFSQFCSLCVILSTRRYYSAQPTDPSIASASLPVLNEDSVRSVAVLVNRTSVGGGVRALSVVGHVTGSPRAGGWAPLRPKESGHIGYLVQ
ncbi:Uncharacterised protein [Mycobacteroides abscessus subsp. abscessus]|nr:Uncharacterised protein [Mycobacteroides abscessus subsp. abscessus]